MTLSFLKIMGFDVIFVVALIAVILTFGQRNFAAFAVLKRNFVSYFSNPTGYAFLCLFVFLTSMGAFSTPEFFNANLANFDQLSKWMPWILLVFIPSVTMSIWAEERRQGTDELLLTLPAADFDIVIGKYLAASAVFTVSLLFSQFCNSIVLFLLSGGDLDAGMLFTTYLGYWLMGLSMLAIGMVASFFTNNLTVGFILGLLFNFPLVILSESASAIPRRSVAKLLSDWSLLRQSEDFGRGVISLSSLAYFVLLAVLGIYLSMVLIGRRHWSGGKDGESRLGHYMVRVLALIVIAIAANSFFANLGIRADTTENRVNSLSEDTKKLIDQLNPKHVINIDAYIGAQVPEDYVKTRRELLSMLSEFESRSRGKIKVRIQDNLEPFSKEAQQAEKRYNIRPQNVRTRSQGVFKDEQLILGAAFTCGLQKVVVPFFDYGIPVEYELIRSINTVAKADRKKLGVVRTDAQVMGGFEMSMGPTNIPKQQIIEELEKQYDVEEVSPQTAIEAGKFDVLLLVQPSSLTPPELANVVDVIKKGQPTAIFEDPLPVMINCPGTGQPKRQNPMMSMFGGGQPQPKGNITDLWKAIGVRAEGEDGGPGAYQSRIIWQNFNPYLKVQVSGFGPEFVFVRPDMPGANEPFNSKDRITDGLEEVMFPYPGAISADPDAPVTFTPLVETSSRAGTLQFSDWQMNRDDQLRLADRRGNYIGKYCLAARIQGKSATEKKEEEKKSDDKKSDSKDSEKKDADGKTEEKKDKPIHVVYIADVDLIASEFVRIRAQPDQEFRWRFENITFVLNIVDSLAEDPSYMAIRGRKTHYSSLRAIEAYTDQARAEEINERRNFEAQYKEAIEKAEKESNESVKKFKETVSELNEKRRKGEHVDPARLKDAAIQANLAEEAAKRRLDAEREAKRREADTNIQAIRRNKDLQIESLKAECKFLAVVIPLLPPMVIGFLVWLIRRVREREGVSKARLV